MDTFEGTRLALVTGGHEFVRHPHLDTPAVFVWHPEADPVVCRFSAVEQQMVRWRVPTARGWYQWWTAPACGCGFMPYTEPEFLGGYQ